MKRFYLVSVLVVIFCQQLIAQPGHYFISHYKPGNDNISYLSYDIQQDANGILYFANRSGVLQYDGRSWTMVPAEGPVFSLVISPIGEIFASGAAGFGRIGLNHTNRLSYLSLSDSLKGSKNIFTSCIVDNIIYFLNEETLFGYDTKTSVAKPVLRIEAWQGMFTGLFKMVSGIYITTENGGLKKFVDGKLVPSDLDLKSPILFSEISLDGKTELVETEDGRFHIRKTGLPFREFKPKDSLYLSLNVVANASWVTDRMVALGTLRGGLVFVDTETDETYEISDFYTGLPDNEIYAVHTDKNRGVWVAHDYGFSRIVPFLPYRTFNHYNGLQGNLLCALTSGSQIYVGTTLGLFLLSRDEIYEDEEYSVTKTQVIIIKSRQQDVSQDKNKPRKGLWGFLKKKKEDPKPVTTPTQTNTTKTKTKTLVEKKTRKVLKRVEYVYKKVEGISGKVDHLLVVDHRVVSAGVGGVFEVTGLKSVPVSPEPARFLFYSKNLNQILVSTYDDEIKSFRENSTGWTPTEFPDSLSSYADYMFEDNLQDIWICGRDRAVKIGIENGVILDTEAIPLPHVSIDRTVGLAYGSEVYLTQNGEFYHYESYKSAFVRYDSLPGPRKYFASAGYFWYFDGHKWRTIDKNIQGSIRTEWLSLFPDIRYLAPAGEKNFWVITSANELYRFSADQNQLNMESNPLFLKEVRNRQTNLSPKSLLLLDERESELTLEFIQPEYVSEQAVEYRYLIRGLTTNWSDWSTVNNIIQFSFLPTGNYQVLVQSKDMFDKVTEINNIKFNVVPPYWRQTWFYALELVFFGFLVVLSFRIQVTNTKYLYVNRFLSALTIVMLIQFIQTIAAAYVSYESTPVADFFIQVFIALLVLPVEEFLRRSMSKASKKTA